MASVPRLVVKLPKLKNGQKSAGRKRPQMQYKIPHVLKSDLERWPPDVNVPARGVSNHLTCGICKGYFFNATTITECLHTFCRSCIIKHVARSLHCPRCEILIHPTDPLVHLRPDSTLQDIVYRLFPDVEKGDTASQKEFYASRGLQWPPIKPATTERMSRKAKRMAAKLKKQMARIVNVSLHHAGTTPELGRFKSLPRRYLRVPAKTTIKHIQLFLTKKLQLTDGCMPLVFVGNRLLQDNVTMDTLDRIITWGEEEEFTIMLQYGIVPINALELLMEESSDEEEEDIIMY